MRRRVIGGALLALVWTAQAAAQAPAAVDPVRLKLAQQVVEATGGRANAQTQMTSMLAGIEKMTAQAMPGMEPTLVHAFQADMQAQLLAMVPALLDISTQAYARELTTQELTDMLAWVRSPSGQSVAAKQIAIRSDIFAAEAPLLRQMMPQLMQKTVDRICGSGKCTPEQRRTLAQAVSKLTGGAPT